MAELLRQAADVLAEGGDSDPWAQRLTAGAAFITAVLGGFGTLLAFTRQGARRGGKAMNEAEDENAPKVQLDDAQMKRVLQQMLNENPTPPPTEPGNRLDKDPEP